MITCPRCGTQVSETARFCPSCGFSLAAAPREERRIVTVLFGDLSGFTAMSETRDPEEVKRIIDRAFEDLAEIVTLYGGYVDKIVGDEIMAVFGAPHAHEDDPERAVRCALEMQRALERYSEQLERERGISLKMRIGINTGEVVAGAIGGGEGYSIIGDAVNVASRLEKAAEPRRILVGASTYAATQGAIEYKAMPPLELKGRSEPVVVFEAVTERALPGEHRRRLEAPLIGRDEEIAVLENLAEIAARDRRPVVTMILGDAGMGKSRLADEFARRLHDTKVLRGRSLPYGTASPSFAVEEMVRAAFDVDSVEDPALARARITEGATRLGIASEADRLAALAGVREAARDVAKPSSATGAGPGSGGGGGRSGSDSLGPALALFEAIAANERLLVLIFQELHWAEDSLLEFVGSLAERAKDVPLQVVALGRPELVDRASAWAGRPGSTTLQLHPMPRDRAAALLDALTGGQPLEPSVRESVLDKAGGNPFFLEEFVRLLLDQRGREGDAKAVPVSVHALVAVRLDGLDSQTKRIIQAASVVGESFWLEALAALEPELSEAALDAGLRALGDKELIAPAEQPQIPGLREYRFRQSIVRDVAYGTIPKQTRARQHAVVAQWLEDVTRTHDLERQFYDLVAFHYERAAILAEEIGVGAAEAAAKASEYLERAGDEALSLDAARTAASFYERALRFAEGTPDSLHLRVHLGEALVGAWRPLDAERHLHQALTEARRVGDKRLEAKALRLLGDLQRMSGDFDQARISLEQALAIARDIGDRHEEAEGLRSHGLADLNQGRVPSAPLWFRQALSRFRELGDKRGEAWALQNLAWANLLLGRVDDTLSDLEQAAAIFGELGDLEGVGWCLGIRSWGLLFQRRLDEADELARQIEELALAGGDSGAFGMAHVGIGLERVLRAIIALERARLGDAMSLATGAMELFREAEFEWGLAMAGMPLGLAYMFRLQHVAARETLDTALAAAKSAGDPLVQGLLLISVAWAAVEAGDLMVAEENLNAGLVMFRGTGIQWQGEVPGRWLRADIVRRRGDLEGARRLLEEALTFPDLGLISRRHVRPTLAEVLCDLGRPAEAVEQARTALDESGDATWHRMDANHVLARALADLGDHAGATEAIKEELALLVETDCDVQRIRALGLLARLLDEAGQHDEAAEALDRAREIMTSLPPDADVSSLETALSR
jgi:class 3 adenylate cyclase/tetratricopeptide (TPR) repeat protein